MDDSGRARLRLHATGPFAPDGYAWSSRQPTIISMPGSHRARNPGGVCGGYGGDILRGRRDTYPPKFFDCSEFF